MAEAEFYDWKLRAETDLWTGDVDGKGDRLITTGLLGSIRWWCEVLVRGLGGSACDPTDDERRCPASDASPDEPGHHCVVCELFGCTDWARKFRFDVLDIDGRPHQAQIRTNNIFILRFTPLRGVKPVEWRLLELTLRLIADYGAIGGRTVLKPPRPDYGIVKLDQSPDISLLPREEIERYLAGWPKRPPTMWASLENFWFLKRCLERPKFNQVLGGTSASRRSDNTREHFGRWMQGRQGESKKIFSFKNPARTFGFVCPNIQGSNYEEIKSRLKAVWPDLRDEEFVTGLQIVNRLFPLT